MRRAVANFVTFAVVYGIVTFVLQPFTHFRFSVAGMVGFALLALAVSRGWALVVTPARS
jgi:hypothetical protein